MASKAYGWAASRSPSP